VSPDLDWREPTAEHREACRESLSPEVIRDLAISAWRRSQPRFDGCVDPCEACLSVWFDNEDELTPG
jgi:hypothetical protein